jgi:hypothetical protein
MESGFSMQVFSIHSLALGEISFPYTFYIMLAGFGGPAELAVSPSFRAQLL